jgi:hypothetical protein
VAWEGRGHEATVNGRQFHSSLFAKTLERLTWIENEAEFWFVLTPKTGLFDE